MSFLLFPIVKAGTPWSLIPIPIIFLLWLAGLAIMLRLSLLLPARAVGNLDLTFKEAWMRTRGNTWRIFWGMAACALPPGVAAEIVLFGFLGPNMPISEAFAGRMAVIMTILLVYQLLTLPIWIGFLSYSYRHFFERT